MRALKKFLGILLLTAGLGWWAVLLGPEMIRTRTLPDFKSGGLSSQIQLAPGTAAVVLGAILVRAGRKRPESAKESPPGAPSA